jgi:hypothetical protein
MGVDVRAATIGSCAPPSRGAYDARAWIVNGGTPVLILRGVLGV